MERCSTKNKTAKDANSESIPIIEKIPEKQTEEYFENGYSGQSCNFARNENVNTWGQRVDGNKIVSAAGSVQQPISRSALGELNNFCNNLFLEGSPVMSFGGNHHGLTLSPPNNISRNNASIASKNIVTLKEKEPFGNKKVLTGLNSFCGGFHQEGSMTRNAAFHYPDVALNLQSIVSERYIFVPTTRRNEELTENQMFLPVQHFYCNNFLQESITATIHSNFLLTVPERNLSAEKNIIQKENEKPSAIIKIPNAQITYCNNNFCEKGSTMLVTDSRHLRLAPNSHNTIFNQNMSIPIQKMITKPSVNNTVPKAFCNNNFSKEGFISPSGSQHLYLSPNSHNTIFNENLSIPIKKMITQERSKEPFANNIVPKAPSTYSVVTGSHHSLALNSHNSTSSQNASIPIKKMSTEEESVEPPANNEVLKALNTYSNNNSCKEGYTPGVKGSHPLFGLAPNSQNTISEKKLSIIVKEEIITEEEINEPPGNTNFSGALNTCYDSFKEGSTSVVKDSHQLFALTANYQNSISENNATIAKQDIITEGESEKSSENKKAPNVKNTCCSNDFCEKVSSVAITGNHHPFGFAPDSQNIISDKYISVTTEETITQGKSKESTTNKKVPNMSNTDCNGDFENISLTTRLGLSPNSQSCVSNEKISMEKMITEEKCEEPVKNKTILTELNTYCSDSEVYIETTPDSGVTLNSRSTICNSKDVHADEGQIVGRKELFFCKIRCLSFSSLEILEDHLRCTHVVENSTECFFCETCKNGFKTLDTYMRHLLLTHAVKKFYSCCKCGMQFPYPHSTTVHQRTISYCAGRCQKMQHDVKIKKMTSTMEKKADDGEKVEQKTPVEKDTGKVAANGSKETTHKCELCHKVLASRAGLLHHSIVQHSVKPYSCDSCGEKFAKKGLLKNHSLTHGEEEHRCDVCQKLFSSRERLRAHRLLHTNDEKYNCKVCKKECKSKASLYSHSQTHIQKFSCNLCDRKFHCERNLLDHRRQHTGEKPFVCDVCGKKFRAKHLFLNHCRIHGGNTYVCGVCHKEFKSKSYLRIHFRTHTGERPHPCVICDMKFATMTRLKRHLMYHTGERPYVCETCGKGFTIRQHLKTHLRVHTGEKPYVCDFCGRGFSQKWVMYTHRRIHTGERPFECEICQRGFIYKSEMKRHRLSHVKDEEPKNDSSVCE